MIAGSQFIYIHENHIVADDIMAHEIYVVDRDIVAKITTDDGAVVKTNRQTKIIEFEEEGFEFTDPYKTKEFATLDKFGTERIGYLHLVPIVRGVAILDEYLCFPCIEFPIPDTTA